MKPSSRHSSGVQSRGVRRAVMSDSAAMRVFPLDGAGEYPVTWEENRPLHKRGVAPSGAISSLEDGRHG